MSETYSLATKTDFIAESLEAYAEIDEAEGGNADVIRTERHAANMLRKQQRVIRKSHEALRTIAELWHIPEIAEDREPDSAFDKLWKAIKLAEDL